MDPVTQGLLGATVVQASFSKSLKKDAWKIGAVSGMLADLDTPLARFISSDPLAGFEFHRHFTHSLLFIPIGGLIAALLFFTIKKYRLKWKVVLAACTLGYATHAPLDMLTSYGTVFFWPFSLSRVNLDIINVIDPVITLTLLVGLIWSVKIVRAKPAVIALFICALYFGFGYYQHGQTLEAQRQVIVARGHKAERPRVLPSLTNLIIWRSLYEADGKFYVDALRTPLFSQSQVKEGGMVKALTLDGLLKTQELSQDQIESFKLFQWFTSGYLAFASDFKNVIGDLRYGTSPNSTMSLWGIKINPSKEDITVERIYISRDRIKDAQDLWRDIFGKGKGYIKLNEASFVTPTKFLEEENPGLVPVPQIP